ncbi:MAG: FtsQ-type POTRA domain-containing protein [Candidatus Peregrinibacteria bacterium]
MFFRKKPKRLYIPTTSRWYTRPRYKPGAASGRRLLPKGIFSILTEFFKDRFRLVIAGLGFVLLIGIGLSSSYLAIQNIEVLRQDFNIDSAAIETVLKPYLGRNILFFPRRLAVVAIQDKFPEFQSVEINKKFPNTLTVNVVNYPIMANLRAYYVLPEVQAAAEQKPPDPGIAFELNPEPPKPPEPIEQKCLLSFVGQAICDQQENLELMTLAIKGLTQPIEHRQQVVAPTHMDYLREALEYFKNNFKFTIANVEYLPVARELHFKIKSGPVIWLTLEKDIQEQLDKLKTIYEPAELNKEDLSYLDLRVKEKVIYCLRRTACDRTF